MTRAVLLLAACSDLATHAPDLGHLCSRAVVAEYTAPPGECVRLDDANGRSLFRLSTSEDCGGPACIRFGDGQTALVLEPLAPGPQAEWFFWQGPCGEVPWCEHSAVCETEPEKCGPAPTR
jgi:hypothetical protein